MNIKERLLDFIKNYCTHASVSTTCITLKDDVLTLDFRGLYPFITIKNGSKHLTVYLYIVAYALSFTYNVKIHLVSHTINTMYDPIIEFKDSTLVYDLIGKLMNKTPDDIIEFVANVMLTSEMFGVSNVEYRNIVLKRLNQFNQKSKGDEISL